MNLITREKNFMNTVITFQVIQTDETTISILDGIEAGFGEFERIVKQYTRFNENSELSNLNRNSGKWVSVSEEFLHLIEYMVDLGKKTSGAFDPTIIDFLEVYGYDKNYDFTKLENPKLDSLVEEIAKNRKSFLNIEISKKDKKVKLEKGQRIDLGGIGKGYAIDCAYQKMLENGLKNFLIDAGGDIRVLGKNKENKNWKVELKHKNRKEEVEVVGTIELQSGESIACSGSWARKVKQFHHLINPVTGKPENSRRTVFVQAEDGITADSWATAIFVGGEKVAKQAPKSLKYFIIS